MEIRPAGPGDAEALSDVAAATFRLACPPTTDEAAIALFIDQNLTVANFAEHLADPNRALLLAEDGGRAVGYAMLVFGDPYDEAVAAVVPERPAVELSKIYVREDAMGGGLATALMSRCLDVAREGGGAAIWLGTNQGNDRALRFYAKSGFEIVGPRRFWVGDHWEDDHILARQL